MSEGRRESTTHTKVELSMTNTAELNGLDLKNPFVTVQVDSNRINQTFTAILDALQNVRVVVSNLGATVDGHTNSIAAVQSDLSDFKKLWEEDPRITALNEKTAAHHDRISVLEEQLQMLKTRADNTEKRLAKQEGKSVDFSPLEKQIKALQDSVSELNTSQTGLRATQDGHTENLTKMGRSVAQTEKQNAELDNLVKALYTVLEMSQEKVLSLVKDPGQKQIRRADTRGTGLTEYVLTLPSFKTMYADFQEGLGGLSTRLGEELLQQKKKLAEESVHLRSKLGEKLDERRFTPVVRDLEGLTKKVSVLEPRMDKLVDELDTKSSLATVQKMYDHLDEVKANKGDLVGLLHRDDLIPLERDIQQLAEAIDRSGAKLKLDIEKNKAVNLPPQIIERDDKMLHAKIVTLEGGVSSIQEDYCKKGDLGDVYMYVDNNLAKLQNQIKNLPPPCLGGHAAATEYVPADGANMRPSSGKNRPLAPLARPVSAGHTRPSTPPTYNHASIPETYRTPSPPINYTSTRATYVPNPAKYRATASVFDSSGNRSTATVTASNVPIVDHWHNVARAAAGQEIVPDTMMTHTMS